MNYLNDITRNLMSKETIISLLIVDLNYNILMYNNKLNKTIGNIKIHKGDSFYILLNFYGEKVNEAIKVAFSGISSEIIHKNTKDNRFFESIIHPLKDENNSTYGVYITSKEISERIDPQNSLEYREKELKALYDNAPLGYQSLDKNGNFIYVNNTLSEMLGYSKNELIGRWFGDFLDPEGSTMFKKKFSKFKEKGETKINIQMLTKNGKTITIMFDGKIAYKDDGSFKQTHCILKDITEKEKMIRRVIKSEQNLQLILNSTAEAIYGVDLNGNCTFVNNSFLDMLGYDDEKYFIGKNLHTIIHHSYEDGTHYPKELCNIEAATFSGKKGILGENILWKKDKTSIKVEFSSNPQLENGEIVGAVVTFKDLTEKLKAMKDIEHEKELAQKYLDDLVLTGNIFENSIKNAPVPIMIHAEDGTVLNISQNWTELTHYKKSDIPTIFDWIKKAHNKNEYEVRDLVKKMYKFNKNQHDGEFVVSTKDGRHINWDFNSSYIGSLSDGRSVAMTVATDITERLEKEKKINYLSYHDQLTGLYNRRFFEEQIKFLDNPRNFPLSIIMGDVNGLKLVNDVFGHLAGDKLLKTIGDIISKSIRKSDVAARWGGDEFTILLPNSKISDSNKIINRIKKKIKETYFEYGNLSISLGTDTKNSEEEDINKIFNSAEKLMYQNKLIETDNVRSETINTIMNILFEKSIEVKEHSMRVSKLAVLIAKKLNLSKKNISDIEKMVMIHDIGNITIDLNILNKPGKLTLEERKIIEQHPLSGSKILNSSREYTRLSSGVLHHHERIDGKGYPNGIPGDQIPIESKIIAVADAFDAMTAIRPYRPNPLSFDEAIIQLKENSGTQFDKTVVDVFINEIINIKQ